MKHFFTKMIVMIFFLGIGNYASAQISEERSTRIQPVESVELTDLVLIIPGISSKISPDIFGMLEKMPGVAFDSYCPHMKAVFIRFDSRQVNSDKIIGAIQSGEYAGFEVIEKVGTVEQVKSHCLKFTEYN